MNENNVNLSQNQKSFREKVGESLLNNKVSILGAILFVFFLAEIKFLLPDLIVLGIPLALLAIWLISWFKKVGWSDLGIYRPKNWPKIILVGGGVALLLQTSAVLQIKLGGPIPDLSSFEQVKNNPWVLLGFLVISWTTAGFGEEIIWRGFFMKQIARLFDDQKKSSWVIGLVMTSIVFGLIHYSQGITGMLMTGFAGLVYGIVFLASRRNLWASIIAHGLTDTSAFILLYYWDTISPILGI
jgi:hypothetical protein